MTETFDRRGKSKNKKRAKIYAIIPSGAKFGRWEILDSGEFHSRDRVIGN